MTGTAWTPPFWIAHRGAGQLAPENTLAAFRQGAALGWRAFECDVKLSQDGVPFLLHDATLDRTTQGHGVAGELDWHELSQLDAGAWHSPRFAGEPLPTLEAVARWCMANHLQMDIEIKPTPGLEAHTGREIARWVLAHWRQGPPPFFSAFHVDALQGALSVAPDIPRALLVQTYAPADLATAQSVGCVAVIAHHPALDSARIAQIHQAGLKALCYTVNDPAEARRLIDAGIDAIITDSVDRFVPSSRP